MKLRWFVWMLFLLAWTAALLVPASVHEQLPLGEFVLTRRALIAKFVHVLGYVAWAGLTAWLRVGPGWRPALVFFLMAHAAGTEFLQDYVPGRTGSVGDVLFNHLGIGLGICISWKWWAPSQP